MADKPRGYSGKHEPGKHEPSRRGTVHKSQKAGTIYKSSNQPDKASKRVTPMDTDDTGPRASRLGRKK
jgi:hypothetical protein